MIISGQTKCCPIIGHPVAHVFTPPVINAWFEMQQIDAVMFAMDISSSGAKEFFKMLRNWENLAGCSITYPYKQLAFELVDEATERATRLGVVNTIRRENDGCLVGDMTDGVAMVTAIREKNFPLEGKTAQVVGAGGGAGRAIVDALCGAGVSRIVLQESDGQRADEIEALVQFNFAEVSIDNTAGFDIDVYINATSLGMKPDDALPLKCEDISAGRVYGDVVTRPVMTPMLQLADQCGAMIISGADMGQAQVELQMAHIGFASIP
ncbi:MAG: shikimate dehydrogenase [Cohaesibacteraceae bacterium]|nr:shikimate dehydrogenase [Cohaesibacteraceae bacterium]MBL4876811.1 shikimate dehydrogenase [Cohaesibacteraceae bacterium]